MSIIFDHDWTAVADTPAGAAGSTAGADQDGGWTDRAGGQASVGGGLLLLAGTGGYGGLVHRPASEAVAHGRVTARPRPLGPPGMFWLCPRVVDAAAGDFYAFRFNLNGNVVVADYAFPFVAGSPGAPVALGLREPAGTAVGDDLTFAIEATDAGAGSTEYVLTITNLTRGGSTTATAADATAALQAPGAVALLSEGGSGTVGLRSVTAEDPGAAPAATTYALTAPTTPHGPVGSASGDFTITPDGPYSGTITTQASPAGGTFAPPVLTWSGDAAPKPFKFTPASAGAKAISATNSGGLTDPAAVTYTADAATPPDPGGPPAERPAVVIAVFGDSTGNMPTGHSNEASVGGGRDGDNWPVHLVRFLTFARGPRSATTWNYSQDGTTTTDWALPAMGATRAADAATRGCTAVVVSLGHNDATAGTPAATYGAKVADLIAAIHDAGIATVYLLDPISDQVSGAAGDLIAAYEAALDGLADGTGVRRLRTRSADRWAPRTDLHPVDVHPDTGGAIALAELVGTFLLEDLEPSAGGGATAEAIADAVQARPLGLSDAAIAAIAAATAELVGTGGGGGGAAGPVDLTAGAVAAVAGAILVTAANRLRSDAQGRVELAPAGLEQVPVGDVGGNARHALDAIYSAQAHAVQAAPASGAGHVTIGPPGDPRIEADVDGLGNRSNVTVTRRELP